MYKTSFALASVLALADALHLNTSCNPCCDGGHGEEIDDETLEVIGETVEELIEDDEDEVDAEEDNEEDKKPKTKKVEKTTWDWELCNSAKPIWTRKPYDIEQDEYDEFYKSITKDKNGPMTKSQSIAKGEVTFKSLLFIPNTQASELWPMWTSL